MKQVHSLASELMALCQRFVNVLDQPKRVTVIHTLPPELTQQLARLTTAAERLVVEIGKRKEQHYRFEGGFVMKNVVSNTPDIPISISPYTAAFDVEDRPIDVSKFGYKVVSSDEAGVAFKPADGAPVDGQGNPLKGTLVIGGQNDDGSPRLATVVVQIVDASGKVLTTLDGEVYSVESGAFARGEGAGVSIDEPQQP